MGSRRTKELEGRLGAWLMRRIQASLLHKSPLEAEQAGARLGHLLFKLGRRRAECARANLALAFPEMSPQEREAIAAETFAHFGRISTDFMQIPRRTPEALRASMEVTGEEQLQVARERGRGAILVTGHFGNWERMSSWISMAGYPLSVIARDANDAGLNGLVNDLRQSSGARVIPRGNAARPILEELRNNAFVGMLPDQNSDEIFIPFFGHLAGTVLGPGVLSERTGAPVIPAYCVRVGPTRYHMRILPPLVPLPGEVKGEGMMRAIHASLEAAIGEHPAQWLWFHDRWRSARRRGLV